MIKLYLDLVQGSTEWFQARCGLLTASEMRHIITPGKLAAASNDKQRAHLYELAAQRITGYVEPNYVSDDMLRGLNDEIEAKELYRKHYGAISDVGFMTNDKWGFIIGCSPDGLVGDDGGVQCKSRRQKFQVETVLGNQMPADYLIQVQTELLVTERKWWDFISFSAGLHMLTVRVYPDPVVQDAIVAASTAFEGKVASILSAYEAAVNSPDYRLIPTERTQEQEITI